MVRSSTPNRVLHPRTDDQSRAVWIQRPHQPSQQVAWDDPSELACVLPNGQMPARVNELAIESWSTAPTTAAEWEALAASALVEEPDFVLPEGYKGAAGAVIFEPDGRIWLVAPTNAFGGYHVTFPKGTMERRSAQATALVEVFEESGLRIRLKQHLIDVKRSLSYTRYYLAERLGGSPADMGWESQAVILAPVKLLPDLLNHPNDQPILSALIANLPFDPNA